MRFASCFRFRSQRYVTLAYLLQLGACTPLVLPPGAPSTTPRLASAHFITSDAAVLPVRRWLPAVPPKAVIVALHGFNDYSRAFEMPGKFFRSQGIACYAYDQRGFGQAPGHGLWSGTRAYTNDLAEFTEAVRHRHPGLPLYVLGESMGAAVALVAMAGVPPSAVDGLILTAPAVWSRETMPWYQDALLETSAHTLPWLRLTGQGLKIVASDNIDMLRGLNRDPLVIKGTRVDTIYGLADLMDEAMERVAQIRTPTLILLGDRDQVIPKEPLAIMLERIPSRLQARVASYGQGYHLLLRDLHAKTPWRDIVAWIANRSQPLPSGSERQLAGSDAKSPSRL